jgi:hypothetical protein
MDGVDRVTALLPDGLTLRVDASGPTRSGVPAGSFPTALLQKGLLLFDGDADLSEEGVGFGVPVVKQGRRAVFPGSVRLQAVERGDTHELAARFSLDLVERLARRCGAIMGPRPLYAAKDVLAAAHRRSPALRRPLTMMSRTLRRAFGWQTSYERIDPLAQVTVAARVESASGVVAITVDCGDLGACGVTELVVMNESGAGSFRRYEDDAGTVLEDDAIGTWDEVRAARADFVCAARRVRFSLSQVDGATLFRGRERIGSRLAWAGFGYSLPATTRRFSYDVRITRDP